MAPKASSECICVRMRQNSFPTTYFARQTYAHVYPQECFSIKVRQKPKKFSSEKVHRVRRLSFDIYCLSYTFFFCWILPTMKIKTKQNIYSKKRNRSKFNQNVNIYRDRYHHQKPNHTIDVQYEKWQPNWQCNS